ncbi:MAG TPA: DUF2339 domain-containing protein, partial [Humisphaera sp.]
TPDNAPEPYAVAAPPTATQPAAALPYAAPPRALPGVPQGDLERAIGLKWAGWVGAVVLVVGAGLGLKYAYDQGWLGGLPHAVRLLLMSLGGFGLIAAGEVVLRRIDKIAAAGLYGAGVAVLFLVAYAGFGWYELYAQPTAFALMGVATVIGVLLAARADLVSIAVLSLIGGHLAPVVLAAKVDSIAPFLTYLLFLQVLALALCWWRATPKWWALRGLALGATALWEAATVVAGAYPASTICSFAVVYAALFQTEVALTTLRAARRSATERSADEESPGAPPQAQGAPEPSTSVEHTDAVRARGGAPGLPLSFDPTTGLIFSALVTAQFVLIALWAYALASPSVRGAWVLGTAAACVAGALAMRGRTPLALLARSLRAQAVVLTVLAVPVLFGGANLVYGWLALAAAFAATASFARTRTAVVAASVTWALSVLALVAWASDDPAAGNVWFVIAGAVVKGSLAVAAITAAVGHAVAALVGRARADRAARDSAAVLGGIVHGWAAFVGVVAVLAGLPGLAGTAGLLLYAAGLWLTSFRPPGRLTAALSAGVIVVAAAKWAAVDLLTDRLSPAVAATPFLNAHLLTGAFVAAAMALVGWTRRDVLLPAAGDDTVAAARLALFQSALVAAVVVLLTLGLSVEVERAVALQAAAGPMLYERKLATQLGWTVLWSAAAAGVFLVDRRLVRPRDPVVAHAAAVALMLVAAKAALVDGIGWRVGHAPAAVPPVVNLQVLSAAAAAAGLLAVFRRADERAWRSAAMAGALVLLLVAGSVEIDRYAELSAAPGDAGVVRQAGWSVWWSVFAVGSVVAGFAVRAPALRIGGLALFGLTLLKVVLVDLAGAGTGWRIVSFIGLGGLLLGT